MKKGLSVLLIAAALFGFYGGATSLNDVLASKDYWEEVGEKSTADMNKLEDGLNQLKDNEKAYLDGQEQLADGEKQLADAEVQLEEGRATLAKGYADYAAAPAKLRAGEAAVADGVKELNAGRQTLDNGYATLSKIQNKVSELDAGYTLYKGLYDKASQAEVFPKLLVNGSLNKDQIDKVIAKTKKDTADTLIANCTALGVPYPGKADGSDVVEAMGKIISMLEDAVSGIEKQYPDISKAPPAVQQKYYTYKGALDGDGTAENPGLINSKAALVNGIETLESLKGLVDARTEMTNEIMPFLADLAKNPEIIEELGGATVLNEIKAGLTGTDAQFQGTVELILKKAKALIESKKAELAQGEKTYQAGLAKLAAGRRELAQGYADYAAAPGKLADGEKQLADGEKQYADGKKQLEDGKKKLAEYEDGEQQVRDGLATLMATEADPGLKSILDRRNGDDKFDDANGHLQLDEGLEAVEVGRGYQAESGDLITKEVTNRAVGTAAGLGAAALAVLAAILSFLKKNKGAAVSAVLAAVAGGIGAGVGLSAGEYYSDIAGSTIGNTPFIAAAVIAVVAAVFAIVHFTAKPEAK